MEIKIESAYLNGDEEQKVNNAVSVLQTKGVEIPFGEVQIPRELASIRVLLEVNAGLYRAEEAGVAFTETEMIAINLFYRVLRKEMGQIATGTQEFVAEKDEATQV